MVFAMYASELIGVAPCTSRWVVFQSSGSLSKLINVGCVALAPKISMPENFWSSAHTNSSMYTLASVVGGVIVNGVDVTELFASTTVLKRVMSGGLATLTGPLSSADTRP